MKKTYSLILVAAACAVLLVSIAVVTPKAVRAAVATLIRDQDNAARHPFTFFAECTGSINCNEFDGSTPGQEYVIQNVSVNGIGTGFTDVRIEGTCQTGGQGSAFLFALVPGLALLPSNLLVEQSFSVTAYCDGSRPISVFPFFYGPNPDGLVQITISGYYVTLP
jgi:hypothetical protein